VGPTISASAGAAFCQRDELKPMRQIWCRSAVPWINDLKSLPGLAME
jgi:hypothetical protein